MTNRSASLPKLSRTDFAIIALIIAVALIARALPGPRTIDDAFITFRYSRNIIDGNGFVYNLGSRVMGTTTPLFTLLMSAIGALLNGRDFQSYAIAVSALADAATAVFLFLIARRLTRHPLPGLFLGLLWGIAPQSVAFAVGGMETSVNILWLVGAMYFYLTDRLALVGAFAGLGLLTRIDAAIWIGPLFAHQAMTMFFAKPRRLPLTTWLAFAVVVVPWLLFSLTYFGTIIPRSVTAKTAVYIMPPGSALTTLIQGAGTPFFEEGFFPGSVLLVIALLYLILYFVGSAYAIRKSARMLPLMAYPPLYIAAFAIANPLIFRWYTAPPLPALFFGLVIGIWALLRVDRAVVRRRAGFALALFAIIPCAWLISQANAWTLHPDHGNDRPAPKMAWHQVELYYKQMADDLIQNYGCTKDTKVAVADIGVVGYYTNAVIIDTVGLISPSMSQYYPADPKLIIEGQNYAIPPAIIHDTQPKFLVVMEAAVRYGLERDADFKREYTLRRTIPTDFYGTGMLLYTRN